MRPTVSQYAQVLKELTEEKSLSGDVLAKNFFVWLKRRGEEEEMPKIIEALEKMEAQDAGKISVTAVTAHPPTESIKKFLQTKAQELFPGKTVLLEYALDPEVLGGVEFRTDETLYDATLRAELQALKKDLLKA